MALEDSHDVAKSNSKMNQGAIQGTNQLKMEYLDASQYNRIWKTLSNPESVISRQMKKEIMQMGCPHLINLLKTRKKQCS